MCSLSDERGFHSPSCPTSNTPSSWPSVTHQMLSSRLLDLFRRRDPIGLKPLQDICTAKENPVTIWLEVGDLLLRG